LDSQLQALARSKKCHYSRYADDITFSFTCSERHLPKGIVELSSDRLPFAGQELTAIIEANGFVINPEKTRLQNRHQRQMVTGLVVNRFPNLRREYIRKTNSMIDALKKHGAVAAEEKYLELLGGEKTQIFSRQAKRIKLDAGDFFIKVLKGRVNYIQMVRGRTDPIYRKLAYRLSCAFGKENKEFLKTPLELLGGSIFIVNNMIDDDSQGTAFLLKDHGLITNQHVIDGVSPATAPHVVSFRVPGVDKLFSAELVYSNRSEDLAVFYPGPDFSEIKELIRSKRDSIAPLDPIVSIGYPNHVEGSGASIATGQTTQLRRNVTFDMWCVDAVLMTGNSGGPIFNPSMEVIGVAARGADRNSSNSYIYGFIPITALSRIVHTKSFKFNWLLAASRAHKTFRHVRLLHGNVIMCSGQYMPLTN
jgi:S1-C subfamily serine protease